MVTDPTAGLEDADYRALAEFRAALRRFLAFSETRATEAGLTPQQHQALLAIRGAQPGMATVGDVAKQLILKPNSASELVDRLETLGLVTREVAGDDRRRSYLVLSARAADLLAVLSATHRAEIRQLRPLLVELLERFG